MSAITSGDRRTPCPAVRRGVREAIASPFVLLRTISGNRFTRKDHDFVTSIRQDGLVTTSAASPTPWRALRSQLGRVAEAASSPLGARRLPRPLRAAAHGRRAARPRRLGPPRDHRRRDAADQARRRLGRPRARPVPPHRHRRRRRPPVARLLPDPRPAPRRADLDHRQGRPRRPRQPPSSCTTASPARSCTSSRPRASSCSPSTWSASCSSSPPAPASRR